MFGLHVVPPESVLSSLLATCEETAALASRLSACSHEEYLRHFLHERSVSYGRATAELRGHGGSAAGEEAASRPPLPRVDGELDCIATAWESIECSALIGFRDALDLDLPGNVLATLRRRMEDGVGALERLRLSGAV